MTMVKICGITNLIDARLAAEAGADLLGLIFFPPSPRYVLEEQARAIVQGIHADAGTGPRPEFVGVFVDQPPADVARVMDLCDLDFAQLHGSETVKELAELISMGKRVIKAFRVRDAASISGMGDYRPTAYLLDTYVAGATGGTGQRFDWTLALEAKVYGPIIVAGGLSPNNVAEAVQMVQPWGVDVSSGVEAEPGRKDPDKVRRFVSEAKVA
jgi:phosphoribosylanthranilate isomerase